MPESGLQRLIYKRVLPGDKLKLEKKSNTSPTGGGARDARFGPWWAFEPILVEMFPQTATRTTSRKNPETGVREPFEATFHVGTLVYEDQDGAVSETSVQMWEPTNARGSEARLSRTYAIPPFSAATFPITTRDVFMVIGQDETGKLGGTWITEDALRDEEGWYEAIRQPMIAALDRASAADPLRGYVDLVSGDEAHLVGRVPRG